MLSINTFERITKAKYDKPPYCDDQETENIDDLKKILDTFNTIKKIKSIKQK